MKFRDFQRHVKDLPVFKLHDVRKFDPDFHRQQISDWSNRGYIQSLAGGYYLLADVQVDESTLFMPATRITEKILIQVDTIAQGYPYKPETILINKFDVFAEFRGTVLNILLS